VAIAKSSAPATSVCCVGICHPINAIMAELVATTMTAMM
jgi:hypothetical protein